MPNLRTPGIPPALVPVLGRALAKNRDVRYGSARELGEALARVREELGRGVASFPPPRPAAPRDRRRPSTARSQAMAQPEVALEIAALRGLDAVERRRAVLALSELGPRASEAVAALAHALQDPDRRVRFLAAAALGRLGPAAEPAVPALIYALEDEAAGNEAAETLVKLGKPAVPTLLEVMRSGQDALRSRAATTLTRIGAGLPRPTPRAH
jgi:HEAT repeat protein